KEGPFPARILLYDHEEKLEEARQELINWPWSDEKVNFLHLPKVEILSADFDIKSIVLASASQIAEVKGMKETVAAPVVQPAETEEASEEKEEVAEVPEPETEEAKPEETEKKEPENLFGFVKNQDISQLSPQEPPELPTPPKKEFLEEVPSEPEEKLKLGFKPKFDYFQNKLSFFKRLNPGAFLGSFRETLSHRGLAVFLLTGAVLLVLLAGLWSLYWFLPKANIVLTVKPKILEKDFVIKLDPSLTIADKENLILPASEIQTTVEGEKEANTTGTKLVGEKAKGKVTIYNRTSQGKTLPAGAEISGPENLKFTLNEGVTVASESAGSDYVKIPGKADVEVTAVVIGSEGNLATGSEFSISNLAKSDFVAKNESSFSEGSSREVQVVAKADEDKLLTELQEELEEKALNDLKAKLTSGQKLVEESLVSQVVEKTFDKKVDDEADKVKLKLQIEITALSFQEDEFKQLAEIEIRNLVPSDFDYDPAKTEIKLEPETSSLKGVFTFQARFKADLVPKLDLEEIKKNLLGKKPVIGKTYLSNLPNVTSFEAQISPKLPESIATFPRLLKRINLEIETE
ncbi:baseplate J/gp47 family protein, partial [Patescibacteria group bacterium]|nr:baseplate J/gp47 family protein [Patescibacteria group bacterium]